MKKARVFLLSLLRVAQFDGELKEIEAISQKQPYGLETVP